MIWIISIILYFIFLLFNKKLGFIYYQLFIATTFLISLSFVQTLDVPLTLYFIFAIVPYIKYLKINSLQKFILLLFFVLHLLISIFINGIFEPIAIFIVRLSGLFIYIYIFSNIDSEILYYKNSERKMIISFLICEVIVLIIGMQLSEGTRLMLNFQCTVGCIATASQILLSYYLSKQHGIDKIITFAVMILLTLSACLSGTRGYIIICIAITSISVLFYCDIRVKIAMVVYGLLFIIFKIKDIINIFLVNLRMGESTGRRHSENLFVLKFLPQRPLFNIIFGHGFGTNINSFSISESIISEVSDSSYTYYILHHVSGFHNFWFTILYSAGVIGLALILILYVYLIQKVIICKIDVKFKIVLLLFIISYAYVLWYRWTATSTCGILEFAIFSIIINYIKSDSDYERDASDAKKIL